MRRWLTLLPLVALLALGADALRAAILEWRALTPKRTQSVVPPYREVKFRTADGLVLQGSYAPAHNGAGIVLAHGYGGDRMQVAPEAQLLAEHGFGVLFYDARAHGRSEGARTSYGDREQLDVRAALDFLRAQPGQETLRLGVLGFSVGATAVLLEAASDARVRALALEGVSSSLREERSDALRHDNPVRRGRLLAMSLALHWGGVPVEQLDAVRAVQRIQGRPLVVVHGDRDPYIPLARARSVFASASAPKQLVVVPGAGHGDYVAAAPELMQRSLLALYAALLTPAP